MLFAYKTAIQLLSLGVAVHVEDSNGASPPAFKGRGVERWAEREDFFLARLFFFIFMASDWLGTLPIQAN